MRTPSRVRLWTRSAWIAVGFVFLVGCWSDPAPTVPVPSTTQAPSRNQAGAEEPPAADDPVPEDEPLVGDIRPSECKAWAIKYAKVVRDGDKDGAERLIDQERILARALSLVELTASSKKLVSERFRGKRPVAKMVDFVHRHSGKTGSVEFLRASKRDERPTAIVRIVFDDGNFDWQEFALARRDDGTVFAEDASSYVVGEFMSETTREKCRPLAEFEKRPALERLLNGLALQNSEKAKDRFEAAAESEDAAATLAASEKLDPGFRETKAVRLALMTALENTGRSAESDAILATWRQESPDDVGAAIVAVVKRRSRGDFADALAALALVEQAATDDPFLAKLRRELEEEATKARSK